MTDTDFWSLRTVSLSTPENGAMVTEAMSRGRDKLFELHLRSGTNRPLVCGFNSGLYRLDLALRSPLDAVEILQKYLAVIPEKASVRGGPSRIDYPRPASLRPPKLSGPARLKC
jgi:hypothetical protein